MKRTLSLLLFLILFLTGCAPAATPSAAPSAAPQAKTLHVFAAASLTDAFNEIGRNFETANPGVRVTFNFAGSQALQTQIEQGAPVDVFASASQSYMDMLVTDNFVAADAPQDFLLNKLEVILPAGNPANLSKLEDLANPNLKLVMAAEAVPVGKYALQALDLMDARFGNGYKDKVLANVVSKEDNVKQVVSKVQLGEADAGIVYVSDAVATPELKTIEIPSDLNVVAKYPIAPLAKSEQSDLAKAFIDYVLSSQGQAILQKWGFAPIE